MVEMAHAMDISVEAEIGAVGYSDPDIRFNARFTEPQEAKRFAQLTGVDALAVAVGTVHRMEMQKAELQFDRLQEIAKQDVYKRQMDAYDICVNSGLIGVDGCLDAALAYIGHVR